MKRLFCLLVLSTGCFAQVNLSSSQQTVDLVPKTEYYANGNKKMEMVNIEGITEVKYYRENGLLKEEGKYKDGKREGAWISYDENGNKNFVRHYLKGNIIAEGLGEKHNQKQ